MDTKKKSTNNVIVPIEIVTDWLEKNLSQVYRNYIPLRVKCISKYQSVQEFINALKQYISEQPIEERNNATEYIDLESIIKWLKTNLHKGDQMSGGIVGRSAVWFDSKIILVENVINEIKALQNNNSETNK